jgi:hypothetical protein
MISSLYIAKVYVCFNAPSKSQRTIDRVTLNLLTMRYNSGKERAKKASKLGHLHMTMKELKDEITKLQAKLSNL